ncbi:MAG: DinB family protein [Gemmatimonadota bacterium]|nr:DinB family protein [Gemmatimonadota bacterium]MDH5759691.1 DinB family protein [Gemmatimonadota bacterium]
MNPAAFTLPRPEASEYNPYYGQYIDMVPEGDICDVMETEIRETLALLRSVPADREEFRYAPEKWSLRESVGHVIDVERLFAFRALWFARGGEGELSGMDQIGWARASSAGRRPLADLADEWEALRRANVALFRSFEEADGAKRGVASGFEVTVRALAWMMTGHELHHRKLIREAYLGEGA